MIREIDTGGLFLGNARDARDLRLLHDHRIIAVVDLAANESPAQLAHDMIYCRFPIIDGDHTSPALVETAIRCLVTLITREMRTLVACSAGMSRSPAIAAAAVALICQRPIEDCLREIAAVAPHDVSPILWTCVRGVYNSMAWS